MHTRNTRVLARGRLPRRIALSSQCSGRELSNPPRRVPSAGDGGRVSAVSAPAAQCAARAACEASALSVLPILCGCRPRWLVGAVAVRVGRPSLPAMAAVHASAGLSRCGALPDGARRVDSLAACRLTCAAVALGLLVVLLAAPARYVGSRAWCGVGVASECLTAKSWRRLCSLLADMAFAAAAALHRAHPEDDISFARRMSKRHRASHAARAMDLTDEPASSAPAPARREQPAQQKHAAKARTPQKKVSAVHWLRSFLLASLQLHGRRVAAPASVSLCFVLASFRSSPLRQAKKAKHVSQRLPRHDDVAAKQEHAARVAALVADARLRAAETAVVDIDSGAASEPALNYAADPITRCPITCALHRPVSGL
jgi:hypothetical protein